MDDLKRQLENAKLPYVIISNTPNEQRSALCLPGQGAPEITTERFSPEELGETTVIGSNLITHRKTIFSRTGEPLIEEVRDDKVLLDVIDLRPSFERQGYFAPATGIRPAYRLSFDSEEELKEIIRTKGGRVELALPYQKGMYIKMVRGRAQGVIDAVKDSALEVVTVHAVQDIISEDDFLNWGDEVLRIADALEAETVTFHPNNVKPEAEKGKLQEHALSMIRKLQQRHRAVIAIETFPGQRRLFRPEDLIKHQLPIVLDVAHISNEDSLNLVRNHNQLIHTIHLSAKGEKIHHLPVDRFCLDILEEAMVVGWRGNVVLEYLPHYNRLVEGDLRKLENFLKQAKG